MANTEKPGAGRNGFRIRLGLVYAGFFLFFSFVFFRLTQLQILDYPALTQLAERQFRRVEKKTPFRIPIFDRNREELAVSTSASSVFVRPKMIRNRREVAKAFAKHLGGTPAKWMEKIKAKRSFVWIQRQVPAEVAKKIASYKLAGVFAEAENKRIYPNGALAGSVLGFTDVDGKGISGVELSQNDLILSQGKKLHVQRDGKGNPSYIDAQYASREEVSGALYLTIDRRLQHAIEEELERALVQHSAKGAMALVMDPQNGEIFAMAQAPGFDPNSPGLFPQAQITNRLVSHLFEPGSTMKTLFAAEAIQTGLLSRSSRLDCGNGSLQIGKRTISEAESDHRYESLPLDKVIQYSSNVGAVRVAQALGVERVRTVLDKFGLTSRTGIPLPGEAVFGPRGDESWVPFFLATVGFGQGVSVTPLQMVSSYAPFANGGYLVRPKLLLNESAAAESLEVRRVLSPSAVQVVRDMLVSVTEAKDGTGVSAKVPGVVVAGKTGTAQKYDSGSGYEGKKYFSSFIGFLPADQPQLLIGVFVDEPKPLFYASQTAAPLFRRVAEKALTILDKNPKRMLVAEEPVGKGRREVRLTSKPVDFSPLARANLRVERLNDEEWLMPDLSGISMREAVRLLGRYSPQMQVVGQGFLAEQTPKGGTAFTTQTPILLKFSTSPSGG